MSVPARDGRPQIFISHAHRDKAAVDPLVDLLSELGAERLRIFCTSSPGFDVPPGAEFLTYIGNILKSSAFVVHFITPTFLQSDFCMLELGAAWAKGKAFPILAPSLTPDDIDVQGSPLAGMKLLTLASGDGLDKLKDRVSGLVKRTIPTVGWVDRRERTLGYIRDALDRSNSRQINRLAAVGTREDHLEIWALDGKGRISHSWWPSDDNNETGWSRVHDFSAPSGAVDIAVSSRGPEHAEVFVLDDRGALWHRWWSPESNWSWWRVFDNDIAGPLTACSYKDGHIEIFAIRKSTGSVIHCWSNEPAGWSDWVPFDFGPEQK